MKTNRFIRVGAVHSATQAPPLPAAAAWLWQPKWPPRRSGSPLLRRTRRASAATLLRGRSAPPSAGFFCPGQMAPISP